MLVHLTEPEILAIVRLAELNNAAHPENEIGADNPPEGSGQSISDAQRQALREAIVSLSPDARVELMALIFFARGNAPKDAFAAQLTLARWTSDASDVDYLAEASHLLPMHLRNAIYRLKSS